MNYVMTPNEERVRGWYSDRLRKINREMEEYQAKKPFPRAKDNQAEKNRQNEARALLILLSEILSAPDKRDPVAAYDINSALERLAKEPTK